MRLLLLTVSVVSVFGREKQVKPKDGSKQATHDKAKLKVPRDHDYYNYGDYYDDYYQDSQNDASFGTGPCSQNSEDCIGKRKAQQCFTEHAVKLNNPTVKMDTDKSLLLNYSINITNEDFLGFAVLNYTQCLRNSEDLMRGELLIDIGSSEYGLVKDEYRLSHSASQNGNSGNDAVGVGQFRVFANTTDILLNFVFLNGKQNDRSEATEERNCPGAGQAVMDDTSKITPNGTLIASNKPYLNNQVWTRHARCQANHTILFKFNYFDTESGYDFVTVTYGNKSKCFSGTGDNTDQNVHVFDWVNTGSEFLLVSFYSDDSVTSLGFEMETKCVENDYNEPEANGLLANPIVLLNECIKHNTHIFLQPSDGQDCHTSDYTDCFRRDYFSVTEFCDDERCQLPSGAYCPGNKWFDNESEEGSGDALRDALPRILGGEPAIPHSWPWAVRLTYAGGHYCGGSLVTDKWVLTAAHCCENGVLTHAKLGEHYHRPGDEVYSIPISRYVIHPDYDSYDILADFCMVELREAVSMDNEKIQVACFTEDHAVEQNATCWTAGWGEQLDYATELHSISVQIYTNEECNAMNFEFRQIDEKVEFCAGNFGLRNRDSCYGDSGGPLVCQYPGSNVTTLYGVTSWGESCGTEESVGVYAKVSGQIDWINDVIEGVYTTGVQTDTTTFTYTVTDGTTSEGTTTEDYRTLTVGTTTTDGTTTTLRSDNSLPLGLLCDGNRWFNASLEQRPRIVGGESVVDNKEWPWVVNLSVGKAAQATMKTDRSSTSHCAGTIITDRFILTAGRCCYGSRTSEMNIYTGSNNFFEGELYETEEYFVHPDYDEQMMDNDICLIKTKQAIKMNNSTAVMCMTDDELEDAVNDYDCWIAGWGRDTYWYESYPALLQSIAANLNYCNDYGNDDHLSLLCTTYPNYRDEKTCFGDIGAPVVCTKENKVYQLGITIKDDECLNYQSGLYTDLRRYTGWMDTVISMPETTTITSTTSKTSIKATDEPATNARPEAVDGILKPDTIGKTIGSFFEMMSSLFEYLDD